MDKPGRMPKPLGAVVGKTVAGVFARQGFASSAIVTRFAEIVGPEVAAHAEPLRLQWPRVEGEPAPATLVLRVEGPAALEIQHLSDVIIERVNRFFGWRAVGRLALRQAPLARTKERKARPRLDPAAVARAAADLPEISDEGLKAALARLGAAIKRS